MDLTNEIVFRPFEYADAEALTRWASSRDELLQWSGLNFTFPLDEVQLHEYAASASDRRHIISGVSQETGSVVAHAELNLIPQHDLGQVRRFGVAPSARGNGIGRALIRWLVDFSFDELELNRLELVVFSFNEPARRCYESAGFRKEGCAHEVRKASDGYWDLIYMALLKKWREGSTRGG
jgi:RimJ/RimL family protein N-acetyltransferase